VKIRLLDVARAAGVSTATVDRVVNNRKGVGNKTSEKVRLVLTRLAEAEAVDLESRISNAAKREFHFLIPGGSEMFLENMAEEVEKKGADLSLFGVRPRVLRMKAFDPVSIATQVRQAADQSDGICLVAIDHPLVNEAVDAAVEQGVPVVTLVSDLKRSRRLAYVGIDNFTAGRLVGYLMGRFLGERSGKVALIAGSLTYRGHAERELGFRSVIGEEFPHLQILFAREAQDENELTRTETCDLLANHPDLVGIYNIGGGSPGVASALVDAGRENVVFIAHELNSLTRRFLVNGVIEAIIDQDPAREIASAMRILMNHHAGRDLWANVDAPHLGVFFRENLPSI